MQFSNAMTPVYNSTSNAQGFEFLHILSKSVLFCFLIIDILLGVKYGIQFLILFCESLPPFLPILPQP